MFTIAGMRMKRKAVVLCAVVALLASARPILAGEPDPVVELRAFLSVPVKKRLESALASGDLRFLGAHSYTIEVPGVPESDGALIPKYGVLAIPGTADAIVSEEHGALNVKAREYAAQYNTLLLRHLRKVSP